MPSAAANDLQSSASFSSRNSPGRLTISAARTNMVQLIRCTVRPQLFPREGACLGALGAGGCHKATPCILKADALHRTT